MVLGCLLAVGAGVGYYLKSSDYEPSFPSSAGVLLMMMVAAAAAVQAATSRGRRKQVEKDKKANKTNA